MNRQPRASCDLEIGFDSIVPFLEETSGGNDHSVLSCLPVSICRRNWCALSSLLCPCDGIGERKAHRIDEEQHEKARLNKPTKEELTRIREQHERGK